jgi:general stress protein 26
MHAIEVGQDGNIWFLSNAKSNKNFEIRQDEHVQLFFSKMSDNQYLSVYGTAHIYTDRGSIEEHWVPVAKAWFDGKDDPDVSVIRVEPEYGYYWDTKDGKAVAFLKWAVAAMGAKVDDGGVEGRIRV